jgi:hypothetical protein
MFWALAVLYALTALLGLAVACSKDQVTTFEEEE